MWGTLLELGDQCTRSGGRFYIVLTMEKRDLTHAKWSYQVIYNREIDQSRGFGFVTMSTVEEA
ncbi:hypothetical protein Hdeb2414_s0014g00432151 [Helianthus debilis subsp. tardiflorus]